MIWVQKSEDVAEGMVADGTVKCDDGVIRNRLSWMRLFRIGEMLECTNEQVW